MPSQWMPLFPSCLYGLPRWRMRNSCWCRWFATLVSHLKQRSSKLNGRSRAQTPLRLTTFSFWTLLVGQNSHLAMTWAGCTWSKSNLSRRHQLLWFCNVLLSISNFLSQDAHIFAIFCLQWFTWMSKETCFFQGLAWSSSSTTWSWVLGSQCPCRPEYVASLNLMAVGRPRGTKNPKIPVYWTKNGWILLDFFWNISWTRSYTWSQSWKFAGCDSEIWHAVSALHKCQPLDVATPLWDIQHSKFSDFPCFNTPNKT